MVLKYRVPALLYPVFKGNSVYPRVCTAVSVDVVQSVARLLTNSYALVGRALKGCGSCRVLCKCAVCVCVCVILYMYVYTYMCRSQLTIERKWQD